MRPSGRSAANNQGDCIDFVPKRDLDQAQQENEHLRKENERLRRETEQLKQETERLRRELEAALRASKRCSAFRSLRPIRFLRCGRMYLSKCLFW